MRQCRTKGRSRFSAHGSCRSFTVLATPGVRTHLRHLFERHRPGARECDQDLWGSGRQDRPLKGHPLRSEELPGCPSGAAYPRRTAPLGPGPCLRSTLEEVARADLIVHVVDACAPDALSQVTAVRGVLYEIGAAHLPELLVLNKVDCAPVEALAALRRAYPRALTASALTGQGLELLRDAIVAALAGTWHDDVAYPGEPAGVPLVDAPAPDKAAGLAD